MAIFGRLGKAKKAASPPPIVEDFYQTVCDSHRPANETWAHHSPLCFEAGYMIHPQMPFPGHPAPPPYQPHQQILVSTYCLPLPQMQPAWNAAAGQNLMSCSAAALPNLLTHVGDTPECVSGARLFNYETPALDDHGRQPLNQNDDLYNLISSKFHAVITPVDTDGFIRDDSQQRRSPPPASRQPERPSAAIVKKGKIEARKQAEDSNRFFAKVDLYANSMLPLDLPRMKLYIPTFPILCLASRYSDGVYSKPSGRESEAHIEADWRMGTKAMVVKSVPMDDKNTIVFAIRGTRMQNFFDWMVNFDTAPSPPTGFLDDAGNYCHAGFLSVARKMIKPVAARLRHLLKEDPRRSQCSLLITGHSAGGAVAALIYSHMLATSKEAESELNVLTGYFKRIHCITFGAPPISLLPLKKADLPHLRKSIFLSFINEGDPIARAEKAYLRSLIDLYSRPAPGSSCLQEAARLKPRVTGKSSSTTNLNRTRPSAPQHSASAPTAPRPIWHVPTGTLSNAGRLVLLRSVPVLDDASDGRKRGKRTPRMDDGVQARIVTDEQLRTVIWGHLHAHEMKLYARRIEVLATNAVTGKV